jgi:hypothetical protein
MRQRRGLVIVVAMLLRGAAACSGDDNGDSSSPTPDVGSNTPPGAPGSTQVPRPTRQAVEAFVDQYCTMAVSCCAALGYPSPLDGCKQVLLGDGTPITPTDLRFAPFAAAYNPEAGAACIAEVARSADAGGSCHPYETDPTDPCWHIWEGRYGEVEPGDVCAIDSDCAAAPGGRSMCLPMPGGSKRCLWLFQGKLGDPCVGEFDNPMSIFVMNAEGSAKAFLCPTSEGLHCVHAVCIAGGAPGAPCDSDTTCSSDSYCDGAVCKSRAPLGGGCNGASCEATAFCGTDGVCESLLPVGSPCGADDECVSGVCLAGRCSAITKAARNLLRCNVRVPPP